jgi:hypothetical protein
VAALVAAIESLRQALEDPARFSRGDAARAAALVPTLYDTPAAFDPSVIAPLLRAIAERLDDPAFPLSEGTRP